MRISRILRVSSPALVIAAVPCGALLWALVTPGWGVLVGTVTLLVGLSIYAMTAPRLQSRPGKRDTTDRSTPPRPWGNTQI